MRRSDPPSGNPRTPGYCGAGPECSTGSEMVDQIEALYGSWGRERYDEAVTQVDHARQCAALAQRDGCAPALVAACLLHDIGHLRSMAARHSTEVPSGDDHHEDAGAEFLAVWFPPAVTEPIRLHVTAKRVLVATDAEYAGRLSDGSRASLHKQGGPAGSREVEAFMRHPFAGDALTLRRYDDAGKVEGLTVPEFGALRALLVSLTVR